MILYALYHGDEFVDIGTARELAELEGTSPKSIQWAAAPSARKYGDRTGSHGGRVVVKIGEDEQ